MRTLAYMYSIPEERMFRNLPFKLFIAGSRFRGSRVQGYADCLGCWGP